MGKKAVFVAVLLLAAGSAGSVLAQYPTLPGDAGLTSISTPPRLSIGVSNQVSVSGSMGGSITTTSTLRRSRLAPRSHRFRAPTAKRARVSLRGRPRVRVRPRTHRLFLAPGERFTVFFGVTPRRAGSVTLTATVRTPRDPNRANNSITTTVPAG